MSQFTRLACLVKIQTGGAARTHLVLRHVFFIGRSPSVDLPLADLAISRQHARVELRAHEMVIVDLNSSNGVFVNGNRIEPSVEMVIDEKSQIRLGLSQSEMYFSQVLTPVEVLDSEEQKKVLLAAMNEADRDFSQTRHKVISEERERIALILKNEEDLAKQEVAALVRASKFKSDQMINEARAQSEQMLNHAQKKAENLEAEAIMECETKRRQLMSQAEALLAEAKVKALKIEQGASSDAEKIRDEAKAQSIKDLQQNNKKAEKILAEADLKYAQRLQLVEAEKKQILDKTAEEVKFQLREAELKAKSLIEEAKKKSESLVADSQSRAEIAFEETKRTAIDAARLEAFTEQEKIMKEYRARLDHLQQTCLAQEAQNTEQKLEIDHFGRERLRLKNEIDSLQKYEVDQRLALSKLTEEYEKAVRVIESVNEVQLRRDTMQKEFLSMQQQLEAGTGEIERQKKAMNDELQKHKEQTTMEFQNFKLQQEEELMKQRLDTMAKMKEGIAEEEERYRRSLQIRASEISTRIEENLIPRLEAELKTRGFQVSLAGFLNEIRRAVDETVVKNPIKEAHLTEGLGLDLVSEEKRVKKFSKRAWISVAVAASVLAYYAKPIAETLKARMEQNPQKYQRRAESIYTPVQTNDWHETYTGNILYLRYYYEAKIDPVYQQQWLLRLNNLELLRTMHLSEDEMIQYMGKEQALITQLASLRDSVDAKYLEEGLGKMNRAEQDAIVDIKKVLKTEENFTSMRKLEKDFVTQFIGMRFGLDKRKPSQNSP